MIVSNLNDCSRYLGLHPLFEKAFEVVKTTDWSQMPLERVELLGEQLFVNNSYVQGVEKEEQILEVHQKYIDIHILLEGQETIGWLPTAELKQVHTPYDSEKDYAFYTDQPVTYFSLRPGDFCIVYPEDAHAPIIGQGFIRKLIVKVLL